MSRKKRRPKHHSAARGTRVQVRLKGGELFVTKFLQKSDNNRELITEAGTFPWSKVEIFRVVKGMSKGTRDAD